MMKFALVIAMTVLLVAGADPPDAAADPSYVAELRGNVADQVIAGFPSSVATWSIERGRVSIQRLPSVAALIIVRTKGLIIPALGQNPSPDLLARIVCHDAGGLPAEAARTRAVPFPEDGDARLADTVSLPQDCFAPIVLLTGSIDPQGESPGKFFAVSGF
ncbi:MAG: hypothetical protein AB1689_07695 [Thermodesulfobacteriota bacterium]